MPDQPTRWGKVEQPAGRQIRLKRRHWAIGDIDTKQGIAIVFGDDDSHARLIEAAPEMLDMLRRYASECAECDGTGLKFPGTPILDHPCEACADICALITKATGGEVLENG